MFYSMLNYHPFRMGTEISVLDISTNNNGEDIHMIVCVWTLKESLPAYTRHFSSSRIDCTSYLNTVEAGKNVVGLWNMGGLEESIAAVLYIDFLVYVHWFPLIGVN